jgi:hypothetical protein
MVQQVLSISARMKFNFQDYFAILLPIKNLNSRIYLMTQFMRQFRLDRMFAKLFKNNSSNEIVGGK